MTIILSRAERSKMFDAAPTAARIPIAYPKHTRRKNLTPASKALKLLSWRNSVPRNTLYYDYKN